MTAGAQLSNPLRDRIIPDESELEESNVRRPLLIVVCLLSGCAHKTADDFSAAWMEGQYNEQRTQDGAAYVRSMVRWLGPALSQSEAECGANTDKASSVKLVVQVNLDGSVRKAMVRPSSARWECVKTVLTKKTFPPPPRDGFWTSGDINN